jgi:hypothetical protein
MCMVPHTQLCIGNITCHDAITLDLHRRIIGSTFQSLDLYQLFVAQNIAQTSGNVLAWFTRDTQMLHSCYVCCLDGLCVR